MMREWSMISYKKQVVLSSLETFIRNCNLPLKVKNDRYKNIQTLLFFGIANSYQFLELVKMFLKRTKSKMKEKII